jgi:hypothetical protein
MSTSAHYRLKESRNKDFGNTSSFDKFLMSLQKDLCSGSPALNNGSFSRSLTVYSTRSSAAFKNENEAKRIANYTIRRCSEQC